MELQHGTSNGIIAANVEALRATGLSDREARNKALMAAARDVMDFQDVEGISQREIDEKTGYVIIRNNPVIRAGVYQYKGSMISKDLPPNEIFNVYRPLEELTTEEFLRSMVGKPIIDEHEMLGGKYARSPEDRGVHGAILETVSVEGLDVRVPLSIFSRTLQRLIDSGKRGLSLGYNCRFEKSSGEFAGITYTYIQRDIRVNHLALVGQGRNGTEVLDENDVYDHFDLALDTGDNTMADETAGADDKKADKVAITLADIHAYLSENAPMWQELQTLMTPAAAAAGETAALDADTSKKDGDTDKAEDEDKDDKDDKKEDKAMDSAAVNSLLNGRLASERRTITKTIMSEVTQRNALAKDLEPHVGTFVFDSMDLADVAAYGNEKLQLGAAKGQELTAVKGFLAGLKKGSEKNVNFAMDSAFKPKPKADGLLGKRINGEKRA